MEEKNPKQSLREIQKDFIQLYATYLRGVKNRDGMIDMFASLTRKIDSKVRENDK